LVDYDDGFVAYLNDVEIARANMTGDPPEHDRTADTNHEAGAPATWDADPFVFLLNLGANVLAVQGHNVSIGSSDLSLIPELLVTCDDLEGCTTDNWDPLLGCVNGCDDGDPCTIDDSCDGGGGCIGVPVPGLPDVVGLGLGGSSPTLLGWDDQGPSVRFDVAGGIIGDLVFGAGPAGAHCLSDDLLVPAYSDGRPNPLPFAGYYYMIRSQSDCTTGSYGSGTGGSARSPAVDCP
jgi:hypothetical protein